MKAMIAVSLGTLCVLTRIGAQTPARDQPAAMTTDDGTISGTVVADNTDATPIGLATVELSSSSVPTRLPMTVTDESGRFSLRQMRAGRFTVLVSKPGYLTTTYGAKRPGGAGVPVVIGGGEHAEITVRLARGAVISGTIRGPGAEPASGVQVQLYSYAFSMTGDRTLGPPTNGNSHNGSLTTDDRGNYRIYGLAPGEYYVAAQPFTRGLGGQTLSPAELDWAERLLGSPSVPPTRAPSLGQAVGLAPVLYPGTVDVSSAIGISVNAGEERIGVDFTLDYVPTASVSGIIIDPDGLAPKVSQVSLVRPSTPNGVGMGMGMSSAFIRPNATGHFSTSGILPGDYVLAARGAAHQVDTSAVGSAGEAPMPLWALMDLHVTGQDIDGVELRLVPGVKISGHLVFEGATTKPPADFTKYRVSVRAAQGPGSTSMGASGGSVSADGTFAMLGVASGKYQVFSSAPAGPSGTSWTLKSGLVHGVDSLDMPVDVGREDIADVVITFTDHPTELTGFLLDAAGRPAPEYYILVASTDRTFWTPLSRRIKAARPGNNGNFRISGLPPGEYYVLALTDLEPNRIYSAAYLEPLVASAIKMTFADGERKTQNFKIASGGE